MSRPRLSSVKNDASREHERIAPLLAWYVNGTLAPREAEQVAAHLSWCETCRDDVDAQDALMRAMRESPSVELAPQAGLAATMERIERREARRRLWSWPLRLLQAGGTARPLVFAVGIQAVVIVMLTTVLWVKLAPPPAAPGGETFRTLSTPAAAASTDAIRLRLLLGDDMTLGALREALAPWHSRIVAGPEGRGIYTVAIDGDAETALAALRATPGVNLAERVDGP
jgi:anti-sigma factor RsiW